MSKEMNLDTVRRIQNKIFADDVYENHRIPQEQDFFYFLGNHPYLYEEFINSGFLTNAEMNYINEHFYDYNVDPIRFENDFKRAMREALPIYNLMKKKEVDDELFELFDDKYTREIYSKATSQLASNGTNTKTGNNGNTETVKNANRQLPMESDGRTFDGIINWNNGASEIAQTASTGSQTINETDINALTSSTNNNGNSTETYTREGNPVEHLTRIWNYLLKPKSINWLTSQLAVAFELVY